jgi:hypothetical protein
MELYTDKSGMSEITCFIRIHAGQCPLLWQLFAGLSLRKYGFNRVPIHVATWVFVVDKTVLKHVPPPSPRVRKFYFVIIIQLVPDSNSFFADAICLISALDSVVK